MLRQDLALGLTTAWTLAGVCLYLMAPQLAPFVMLLAVVAPCFWCSRWLRFRQLWPAAPYGIVFALAAVYLPVNASWSLSPVSAYLGVATFLLAVVVVSASASAMPDVDAGGLRAMGLGFCIGYGLAAALLCVEILWGHPFHLRVLAAFPSLSSNIRGAVIEGGIIRRLPPYYLNKDLAGLVMLMWPVAVTAARLGTTSLARTAALACVVPALVAVMASHYATAKIALLCGIGTYVLHLFAPRIVKPLLMGGWSAACVVVVPAAILAYALGLQHAPWLVPSAQHRIVIWHFTSQEIARAPILGSGISTARETATVNRGKLAPGTKFEPAALHSHNVFLQIWLETGVVGVLLLLGIGLSILHALSRAPPGVRGALYAAFVTCTVLASSSFSIWAPWFLASLALAAVFATFVWTFAGDGDQNTA